VKFLVDNQLPPALARLIQFDLGAEAAHVADLGMRDASDDELWNYAAKTDSVLISKDEDFVRLVLNTEAGRLVWVRVGNCRRELLLDVFRRVWPWVIERLDKRDRFIEVR
jgi:predicted nuclease of predicted toxin-antitoxin system